MDSHNAFTLDSVVTYSEIFKWLRIDLQKLLFSESS